MEKDEGVEGSERGEALGKPWGLPGGALAACLPVVWEEAAQGEKRREAGSLTLARGLIKGFRLLPECCT